MIRLRLVSWKMVLMLFSRLLKMSRRRLESLKKVLLKSDSSEMCLLISLRRKYRRFWMVFMLRV